MVNMSEIRSPQPDAQPDAALNQTGGVQLVSKEGGPHIDVTISADELSLIKNTFELEELAIERLPDPAAMFIEYGAEDETSKRANLAAWGRYALRPRVALDDRGLPVWKPSGRARRAPMLAQVVLELRVELLQVDVEVDRRVLGRLLAQLRLLH